jgi:hypothetical protein
MSMALNPETPIAPTIRWFAAVFCLLTPGSPAAIPLGVRAIIVDAVELMFQGWLSSHIGEKVGIIVPARVGDDAATAVVLPILVLGVEAAISHAGPSFPFRSTSSPVAVASVFAANGGVFSAAARRHGSAFQIGGRNGVFIAAVAKANPVSVAAFCVSQRDNGQEVEASASEIEDLVFTLGHTSVMATGNPNVYSI